MGYKSEFGVPRVVVRQFARLAGLLELADDEFVRIRSRMQDYTEEIRKKIALGCADDVLIDIISLLFLIIHLQLYEVYSFGFQELI